MSSLLDYAFRFAQYLDLMLLFGLPLFAWYCPIAWVGRNNHDTSWRRWLDLGLLVCALLGFVLAGVEIVRNATGIMGVVVSELTRDDLAWYLFDTPAGRAGLARAFLLVLLVAVLGWHWRHRERPLPIRQVSLLAAGALASLAWSGHAAGGEGASGIFRLVAGIAHLLAAGGWIGAIAGLLMLLIAQRAQSTASVHLLWRTLHSFSRPGTVFVGILIVSGILHYGDLVDWSASTLFHSQHGNLLLLKLVLFGAMLVLAALHRWWLVPQLASSMEDDHSARSVQDLRLSVVLEATIALIILDAVAVLGTFNPLG